MDKLSLVSSSFQSHHVPDLPVGQLILDTLQPLLVHTQQCLFDHRSVFFEFDTKRFRFKCTFQLFHRPWFIEFLLDT